MKASDPSLKLVCPVCGAQLGERCEMNNADLRFESHRERHRCGKMTAAKFGVGDTVRFIGTDKLLTVARYRKATDEYRLQPRDYLASSQWVLEIYLELALPASSQAVIDPR
jgi:hypothetical protein